MALGKFLNISEPLKNRMKMPISETQFEDEVRECKVQELTPNKHLINVTVVTLATIVIIINSLGRTNALLT